MIGKHCPPMTREEEISAFIALRAGDETQQERLILANQAFVATVAQQYIGRGIDFEDAYQEGILGLNHAIDKFDLTQGFKLISYAVSWIHHYIQAARVCYRGAVTHPYHRQKVTAQIASFRSRREQETLGPVTMADAGGELGIRPDTWEEIAVASLDAERDGYNESPAGSKATLLGRLVTQPDGEGVCQAMDQREILERLMENLPPRTRQVVRMRFGIGLPAPLKGREVGEALGISRQRVEELQKNGLKMMAVKYRLLQAIYTPEGVQV